MTADPVRQEKHQHRPMAIEPTDTFRDVIWKLREILRREDPQLVGDYFMMAAYSEFCVTEYSVWKSKFQPDDLWSSVPFQWIAVYPVTNQSGKGVKLSCDLIIDAERYPFIDAKYSDFDTAWRAVHRVAELLGV